MLKEKLSIIIVTFNRCHYLERTLKEFTSQKSPIKDFEILVLDNNSEDKTKDVVKEFQKNYPNIKYKKNNYNIGANANIARAFELATKDYIWVLADDDCYHFDNWGELEYAINNNEEAIIVSRMDLPDNFKNNIAKILTQCAFVSACIFHKSLLNSTVMRNMYDNIYSMFPHLIPLVNYINEGKKFFVLDNQIVEHGLYQNKLAEDSNISWVRGNNIKKLYRKSLTMSFETGFAVAISALENEQLKEEAMELLFKHIDWRNGERNLKHALKQLIKKYSNIKDISQITDIWLSLNKKYTSAIFITFIKSLFDKKINIIRIKIKIILYKTLTNIPKFKRNNDYYLKLQKWEERLIYE